MKLKCIKTALEWISVLSVSGLQIRVWAARSGKGLTEQERREKITAGNKTCSPGQSQTGRDLCGWSASSEAVGPCRGLTHRRYPDWNLGPVQRLWCQKMKQWRASLHLFTRINLLKTKKLAAGMLWLLTYPWFCVSDGVKNRVSERSKLLTRYPSLSFSVSY